MNLNLKEQLPAVCFMSNVQSDQRFDDAPSTEVTSRTVWSYGSSSQFAAHHLLGEAKSQYSSSYTRPERKHTRMQTSTWLDAAAGLAG